MKHYSEHLWQSSINSHYQLEGYTETPTVNTTKLKFPPKTSRQFETLFQSLFYPNNIMNEFFHRFNSSKFDSPLCECGRGEQNSLHLLIFCHDVHIAMCLRVLRDTLVSGGRALLSYCKQEGYVLWLQVRATKHVFPYKFTTYQDARRVTLVDGLEYLKQIFYEYHPLSFSAPLLAAWRACFTSRYN